LNNFLGVVFLFYGLTDKANPFLLE